MDDADKKVLFLLNNPIPMIIAVLKIRALGSHVLLKPQMAIVAQFSKHFVKQIRSSGQKGKKPRAEILERELAGVQKGRDLQTALPV